MLAAAIITFGAMTALAACCGGFKTVRALWITTLAYLIVGGLGTLALAWVFDK